MDDEIFGVFHESLAIASVRRTRRTMNTQKI